MWVHTQRDAFGASLVVSRHAVYKCVMLLLANIKYGIFYLLGHLTYEEFLRFFVDDFVVFLGVLWKLFVFLYLQVLNVSFGVLVCCNVFAYSHTWKMEGSFSQRDLLAFSFTALTPCFMLKFFFRSSSHLKGRVPFFRLLFDNSYNSFWRLLILNRWNLTVGALCLNH